MKSIILIISDILSVITVSLCFILKVPQILRIIKSKSHVGLNLPALILELSSYTTTMMYNFMYDHAVLTYLEYPLLIIQEYIIIGLVLHYSHNPFNRILVIFFIYSSISFLFVTGVLNKVILNFMVPMTTPVGGISKIMQLIEIIRKKNSDSVSTLTWFLSVFTNVTRIYTIWVDSRDLSLLVNFSVSSVLSGSVLAAAIYYQKKPVKNGESKTKITSDVKAD